MGSNFYEDMALPQSVEEVITRICDKQKLQPLDNLTRQALAHIGEQASLRILTKIEPRQINSFDRYTMFMIKQEFPNFYNGSPNKRPTPSSPVLSSSPFSSPTKTCRLMVDSRGGDDVIQTAISSPSTYLPKVTGEERFSPELVALGELEFRKAFLILNYIGSKQLETVITADVIRTLKDLAMDKFEEKVWDSLGRTYNPSNRCTVQSVEWESRKTYQYLCQVNRDGTCTFKGPFLETGRTHLQRVLGDENVLMVRFEKTKDGKISVGNNGFAEYKRIAREGILVGLRHYRFFVFKDGGKGEKKDPTSSHVKCIFVRFESNASTDAGQGYILSGKTVQEARAVFMHVHTESTLSKYIARFSLILSKTMTLEVDFANVNVVRIKDIVCQDRNGNCVYNKDGDPCILTDGTGFISEDLALKCPKNVFKGKSIANGDIVEGKLSDIEPTESQHRVPPLLIQFRLFHNGVAVKGTLLVNKKLPPRTIQFRESMIKVKSDPSSNISTRNSLEVVSTSNQPKRTYLSRNLILLLSYGGVPDDIFMEILKKELEELQGCFSNRRTAMKVALNRGGMDDYFVVNMISSGIPLDESYLQYRLSIMLNEDRKGLLMKGKVPISDSCYLMGTVDPSGVLESDQVCIILDNGQISGKVLVYRNPGLHFGDIHVLTATYVKELDKYIGHAKYAIFFPSKGPRSLADEMAGGDFDGDMFFVSTNPQLLDYFKFSEPWIEDSSTCGSASKRPSEFSNEKLEDELFELFLKTNFEPSYAMGSAADYWLALMDRFVTLEDSNSAEKSLVKKNLLCLINKYYEALDAPKTGKKVEIPRELKPDVFPHYMEKENSFKSTSIVGKMYDFVESYELSRKDDVRKLPCFDVDFPVDCGDKWKKLYDEYKYAMKNALTSSTDKELKDKAAKAVIDNYKKILYGAAEFEQRERPLEEIYKEAIVIYHVCYEEAISRQDVSKCSFAWKVAGSALLNWYITRYLGVKNLYSIPSVLKEMFI